MTFSRRQRSRECSSKARELWRRQGRGVTFEYFILHEFISLLPLHFPVSLGIQDAIVQETKSNPTQTNHRTPTTMASKTPGGQAASEKFLKQQAQSASIIPYPCALATSLPLSLSLTTASFRARRRRHQRTRPHRPRRTGRRQSSGRLVR